MSQAHCAYSMRCSGVWRSLVSALTNALSSSRTRNVVPSANVIGPSFLKCAASSTAGAVAGVFSAVFETSCAYRHALSEPRRNESSSMPSIAGRPPSSRASDSRNAGSVSSRSGSVGSPQLALWQITIGCGCVHAAAAPASMHRRLVARTAALEGDKHAEVDEVHEVAALRERDPVGRQVAAVLDDHRGRLEPPPDADRVAEQRQRGADAQ